MRWQKGISAKPGGRVSLTAKYYYMHMIDDEIWCESWERRARKVIEIVPFVSLNDEELAYIAVHNRSASHWFEGCGPERFQQFNDFWESGWFLECMNAKTAAAWALHQAVVLSREFAVQRRPMSDAELKEGVFGWPVPITWYPFSRFLECEVGKGQVTRHLSIEQCLLLIEWLTYIAERLWYFQLELQPMNCRRWRALLEEFSDRLLNSTSNERSGYGKGGQGVCII